MLKKSEPKLLLNSDSTDENESESNEKSVPKLKLELEPLADEPDADDRDEPEESKVKSGPQFFFPNSSMLLLA